MSPSNGCKSSSQCSQKRNWGGCTLITSYPRELSSSPAPSLCPQSPPLTWPGETWSCRWGTSTGQSCRPPLRRSSPAAEGTRGLAERVWAQRWLRRQMPKITLLLSDGSDADEGNLVLSTRLQIKKKITKTQNHTGQGFIFGMKRSESRERNGNVT